MTNLPDLNQIVSEAIKTPVTQISPELAKETISPEQCSQFVRTLGSTHGLTDAQAFIAISLLFLKGACNQNAPKTMGVDIHVGDPRPIVITKYDIEYACYTVTNNILLRRFAQAMAPQISEYAEQNNLSGDLAIRLNTLAMSKGGPPLNSKEKAWASSFCQCIFDLASVTGDRLPTLLAEDFQKRFGGKKKESNKNVSKTGVPTPPRTWKKGNPQKETLGKEKSTEPGVVPTPPAAAKKRVTASRAEKK